MNEQERIILGIIVTITYILSPMDSAAFHDTNEEIITANIFNDYGVPGSHLDVCCDLVDVGFLLQYIDCTICIDCPNFKFENKLLRL